MEADRFQLPESQSIPCGGAEGEVAAHGVLIIYMIRCQCMRLPSSGAIDVERVPQLSQAVMKKYSFSIEGECRLWHRLGDIGETVPLQAFRKVCRNQEAITLMIK